MKLAGPASPAYFLYHTFWCALDWLFLPTCGGCDCSGTRWCETCQQKLLRVTSTVCPLCGDPNPGGQLCQNCKTVAPEYQALRSYALFSGPIRAALHRLKYKGDIGLGEALSKHLIELYNLFKWEIDLVVPVPLSVQRIKERGYNQASLLGRPFAYAINKPYRMLLYKKRDTRSQVGLSANERHENVEDAFAADTKYVVGKSVLVIDDVTTTGSTINACAKALHQAGASAVFGLTLARAILQGEIDDKITQTSQ